MEDDSNSYSAGDGPSGNVVGRWIPAVVVLSAVVGFMSLAWYAYHAGTQSVGEDDVMVVEADKTPVKEKPADPGGMQFPDQDKTIFETFAGNNAQLPPKVERVLPSPEEPLPKQIDTSDTTTWVNKDTHDKAAEASAADNNGKPEQVIGSDSKKANAETPAASGNASSHIAQQMPVDTTITSYSAQAPAISAPAAQKVDTSSESSAPEVPTPAPVVIAKIPPKPVVSKPMVAKPAVAKTTGTAVVQLGACRSEKEAQTAWAAMQKKFSGLSDKAPVIVKADLGDKGIYYRLRTSGFASAGEAKSFCSTLSAKGQACILSNGK